MVIGTMHLGDVEALGPEYVTTKYLVFGIPIFPISSTYVVGPGRGFEIPLNRKSIGLGYLRIISWVATVVCGLLYFAGARASASLLTWTVAWAAVAVLSTFILGRLSAPERLRRTTLATVTGLGAPPEWVPENLRAATLARLEGAWAKAGNGKPWEMAIEAGADDPALFVLAEYAGRRDLAAAVLGNMARDGVSAGQPYR